MITKWTRSATTTDVTTHRMVRFAPAVPHAIIGAVLTLAELGGPDRSDAVHFALTAYLDGDVDRASDPEAVTVLGIAGRRSDAA